jgi:hypothetical protein
MNPNYRSEIVALLERDGSPVEVVDLMGMETAASNLARCG